MFVYETPNRSSSRWLQACAVLCATVVLPFGIACAQDYEAVGERLRTAVEAKELTGEQARAMLATLRKATGAKKDQNSDRAKAYVMKVSKELDAAVEAGEISREDAAKRYEGAEKAIRQKMAGGRNETQETQGQPSREEMGKVKEKIWAGVEEGKLTEAQAKERWEGYLKRFRGETRKHGQPSREEMGKVKEKIWAGVGEGKLTEAQAKERWEGYLKRFRGKTRKQRASKESKRDEGLAVHYEKMGVSDEKLGQIKKVLADNAFKPKQMAGALGGMIRVIHEMKSEGDDFELNPRMQEYFEERVGLTDKQIELIEGLARRLLHGLRESDRQR